MAWIIAEWADGTWCNKEEIHEMTHMSDDYALREVIKWNEDGTPLITKDIK